MDPHAVMVRFRTARAVAAFTAAQRALRTAVTTPTSETESRAGFLTILTPRAKVHPRCVTLGADELHAILRVTTPHHVTKPEKRKHLVLQEALGLAASRLGEITTSPSADTLAAARLASRELAKWLARHDRPAAASQHSIATILAHENTCSHFVPSPAEKLFSKPPARKTPDQRWRNRPPEAEVEFLRLSLFTERLTRPQAEPEQLDQIDRRIARLEVRHAAAVAILATQETNKHGQESPAGVAGEVRPEAGTEILRLPSSKAGQGQQQQPGLHPGAVEAGPPAAQRRKA